MILYNRRSHCITPISRKSGQKGKSRIIGESLIEEMAFEFNYGYKGKSFVFASFSMVFSIEDILLMNWH